MSYEFSVTRRVEFAETDAAGILHFSNYYRYMEAAEHAFFRSLGLRVHGHGVEGVFGWARGEASCRFKKPLHNEDLVRLHILVRAKTRTSLGYVVRFAQADGVDPRGVHEFARGSMTVVCVAKDAATGVLAAREIPPEVDALVQVAPDHILASLDIG